MKFYGSSFWTHGQRRDEKVEDFRKLIKQPSSHNCSGILLRDLKFLECPTSISDPHTIFFGNLKTK